MVQDQHQLSEPQAPLTIIDLLLLLMFITAASRKSDFGENRTEGFSSKTPRADRTVIVFDKQMDTKITQVNSHYTKCHRSGQLTKSTS